MGARLAGRAPSISSGFLPELMPFRELGFLLGPLLYIYPWDTKPDPKDIFFGSILEKKN